MNLLRKLMSVFLLIGLLLSASPGELVHDLFHKHESIDFACTAGCGDHVSVQHDHCDLIQLTHPPLYCSLKSFSFSPNEIVFFQESAVIVGYHFFSSPFLFFRGPPSLG